jgi:two-component system, OmpR family, phosphate regulon sensor histidine kinase PhoR
MMVLRLTGGDDRSGGFMPSRQRSFWNQFGWYGLIFAPLAGAALAALCLGLGFSVPQGMTALGILGAAALCAAALAAYLSARRFAEPVDAVRDVLQQVSRGNYDGRLPATERHFVESLAESLDRMQEHLKSRFTDLQASRDQLRTVLNSMVEGVLALDEAQRVLLVNDSACRLFRIQENASIGRPVWELIRNPQLQQWVNQAFSEHVAVGGELELVVPPGKFLSVRVVAPISPSNSGAVVVASDISELRRLEEVRQEFVANASHELKTPLASIKACLETLLDGAIDDLEHRGRFLQTMNDQTERLDHLVRDLLSLTRIETEGVKTELHAVALVEIVNVCAERHRQYAERKQMQLLVQPPVAPIRVLGDEEALEQILDNLIDNAIKYTNDGGTVTVRWTAREGRCLLEVEDTGIGIPQSHLSRIFERFYRVDRARSRELGGTGLGLSIVKHLVQSLVGAIDVASRLGKGSVFSVRLKMFD